LIAVRILAFTLGVLFVSAMAVLTALDFVDNGVTVVGVLGALVIGVCGVGIIGALLQPPRK
jgi:hypothetical protein